MITTDTRNPDFTVPPSEHGSLQYYAKCPYCENASVHSLCAVGALGEQGGRVHVCKNTACGKPFVTTHRVDVECTTYKIEGLE